MKQRWKKIAAMMLTGMLMLSMAACGKSEEQDTVAKDQEQFEAVQENLESGAEMITKTLVALNEEERAKYVESKDPFTVAAVNAWEGVMDEVGALKEVKSVTSENTKDNYTAVVKTECENEDVDFIYTYDKESGMATGITVNVQYSLATNMERAGMNTLMGMGIVFIVLVFLSFLISLFKFVNKPAKKAAPAPAPVAAPVPVVEEEDLTDDLELVAVITAAIAASEETSGDGFVVRSIKKVNRSKWQRA